MQHTSKQSKASQKKDARARISELYPFINTHAVEWQTLKAQWKSGTDFLGTSLAFLGGAMTWVSTPALVTAISKAGGFGVLASGAMSPALLKAAIQQTKKAEVAFGVNLIVMHPQLEEMIDVCLQENISHVILAGGAPSTSAVKRFKEKGVRTLALPPTGAIAKRYVRMGIDGLIIEGSEAGGHIGPVSTSVLAQEILPLNLPVPVFIAGGIASGEICLAYLNMGASGCQMGTLLVCATESPAHDKFKKAFIRASAREAVTSTQLDKRFPVIPVRALRNQAMQAFEEEQRIIIEKHNKGQLSLKEGQLQIEHFWSGALRRAVQDGEVEKGSLMAGQSVGMVTAVKSTQEIFADLLKQTLTKLAEKN